MKTQIRSFYFIVILILSFSCSNNEVEFIFMCEEWQLETYNSIMIYFKGRSGSGKIILDYNSFEDTYSCSSEEIDSVYVDYATCYKYKDKISSRFHECYGCDTGEIDIFIKNYYGIWVLIDYDYWLEFDRVNYIAISEYIGERLANK